METTFSFELPDSVMLSVGKPIGAGRRWTKYEGQMNKQYRVMRHVIERHRPKSVLDIGCGIAGIDVGFVKLGGVKLVYLMDGAAHTERSRGYNPEHTTPWEDVQLGYDLVRMNVPADVEVNAFTADVGLQLPQQVDMIFSSQSWGYHYPVPGYLPLAARTLAPEGIIVLDIRRKTSGEKYMAQAGYQIVDQIPWPSNKFRRLVYQRK